MADQLSRRDFLKLAGAGALGLAFRKPIETVDKAQIAIEQEKAFETDNTVYLPIFEDHSNRNSDGLIIQAKPNYLFIEFVNRTDVVLNRKPLDILTAEGGVINGWQNINEEKISVGRFLSHDLLVELDNNQSSVSLEGIRIQDEIQTNSAILRLATIATTGASVLASWGIALKHKFLDNQEPSKNDHIRIFASTLASLWSTSDEVSQTITSAYYSGNDSEINNAKEIATRFNASVSFAHPEDVVIFMRNVFMSLKLMTLAEQDKTGGEKNKIAFRVGAAHGAISDMIKFGKDITLTLLDVYPKDILKQIVKFNTSEDKTLDERIQDFCTTMVIPVHEARMTDTGTKYLTDERLKDYLTNRFTETS